MARRKLSEKHVSLTMPNDMAQQLQRFADRNAMKLGPFIRHICQDYLNDLTGGDLDTTGRGRRAA